MAAAAEAALRGGSAGGAAGPAAGPGRAGHEAAAGRAAGGPGSGAAAAAPQASERRGAHQPGASDRRRRRLGPYRLYLLPAALLLLQGVLPPAARPARRRRCGAGAGRGGTAGGGWRASGVVQRPREPGRACGVVSPWGLRGPQGAAPARPALCWRGAGGLHGGVGAAGPSSKEVEAGGTPLLAVDGVVSPSSSAGEFGQEAVRAAPGEQGGCKGREGLLEQHQGQKASCPFLARVDWNRQKLCR